MSKISELSDDLLVKILSFLPTKVAVSTVTSVLSKQWEFLWMWLPKLEYNDYEDLNINHTESSLVGYHEFIYKNLPLHRAPIIESLRLKFSFALSRPENIKQCVGIAFSRRVRKLSICYFYFWPESQLVLFPSSLYTCKSLVTLKLEGYNILVDVPPTVCLLPCLKTLKLRCVRYLNEDSLRLLLSYCPVLEYLRIDEYYKDNARALVVDVPTLQRLSLSIDSECSSDRFVIVTPFLKYFKVVDCRESIANLIEHMPKLEEADIDVKQNPEKLLESITSVKRLSLQVDFNSTEEPGYYAGIVFNHLEHLSLGISNDYGYKLLVRLLKDSPKLRDLNIYVHINIRSGEYQPDIDFHGLTSLEGSSVPKCLLNSLETFAFLGYMGSLEERDFLSFIFKHAAHLKASSISQ